MGMVLSPITSGRLKVLKGEVMTIANPPTEPGRPFPKRLQRSSSVYGRPISRTPSISYHSHCVIRKPINTCRKLQPGQPSTRKVESTATVMETPLSGGGGVGFKRFYFGVNQAYGAKLCTIENILSTARKPKFAITQISRMCAITKFS